MTERRKEIGACGNHCGGCLDFRATAENDDALRRQVAAAISRELNQDITPEQVNCEGCWGSIHTALAASEACDIRQCVDGRGFSTCAECKDFPCPTFLAQFPKNSDCAGNIRAIRDIGMEAWLDS